MKRLPAILLATVLAVALSACGEILDNTPLSVGQVGTLLVVADSATWNGPVGDVVREEFGGPITTLPQPEPFLTLQHMDLTETFFPQIRRQHSVLVVGPYTNPTTTGRFLRARLDDAGVEALERGGRGVFHRPNLWAHNQLVVYATAPDDASLTNQIRTHAEDARTAFNDLNRQRLTTEMFRRAQQTDIEEELLDRHGFAVNVQYDYMVVRDTTFQTANGNAGTFVRMRRLPAADSWRDFFVYYEEDPRLERLHPDSVLTLRNRLSREFVLGTGDTTWIRVQDNFPQRRPIITDTVSLGGRWALETRGTWYLSTDEGRSMGMGGPFVNYAFYDEDSGRFYLVDGMVFAPRYDKREFLRQVEVVAHTFRTHDDAPVVLGDRLTEEVDEGEPPPGLRR